MAKTLAKMGHHEIKHLPYAQLCIRIRFLYGAWRSLVARVTGGHEVAGSSPVAPNPDNSGDFAGCPWEAKKF